VKLAETEDEVSVGLPAVLGHYGLPV